MGHDRNTWSHLLDHAGCKRLADQAPKLVVARRVHLQDIAFPLVSSPRPRIDLAGLI